jgi:hypothetical protein
LREELQGQLRESEEKEKEFERQRQAKEVDVDRLSKQNSGLSEQLTKLRNDQDSRKEQLTAQHDLEVDGLKRKHLTERSAMEKNGAEKLEQLRRGYDEKMKIAQEKHKLVLDGKESELNRLRTEVEAQKSVRQRELEPLREKEAELKRAARLIEEQNARIRNLESNLTATRRREQASISREKMTAGRLANRVTNEQNMQKQLDMAKKEMAEMSQKLKVQHI